MLSAFKDPFLQTALAASVVVGAALAQVSSAGVGLAIYTGSNPSVLSLALALGGVAAFSVRSRDRNITQESLIGVGYAVASALAVLFVAKSAQGEAHLLDVLSGNILTVTRDQVWWMAAVGLVVVAVHSLLHKQLLFSAFDPETARASGYRVPWWDLVFFVMLGVVISLAIRLAGTLLVFAFLVLPAVTALLLSRHLGRIYAVAIGAAAIASVGGLYASLRFDLPSGPAIVAVLCGIFLLALAATRIMRS